MASSITHSYFATTTFLPSDSLVRSRGWIEALSLELWASARPRVWCRFPWTASRPPRLPPARMTRCRRRRLRLRRCCWWALERIRCAQSRRWWCHPRRCSCCHYHCQRWPRRPRRPRSPGRPQKPRVSLGRLRPSGPWCRFLCAQSPSPIRKILERYKKKSKYICYVRYISRQFAIKGGRRRGHRLASGGGRQSS